MDFSTIEVGVKRPTETTVKVTEIKVGKETAQNGSGADLELEFFAPNTPEANRAMNKWQTKFGISGEAEARIDATEEELEKFADSGLDLLARLVVGWNLSTKDGKAIECSDENKRGFFAAFEDVGAAAIMQFHKKAEALGKQKTG